MCDDNRIKLSLNPFSASFSASEDILKLLISSAKNAKCPGEGNICCAIEFTKEVSVDCVMSKWSTCSQTCGPGTQNRAILMSAKNSGKECPGNLNRACTLRNCPSNQNPGDYDSFAANVCNLPENLGYSGMLSINFKALFLLIYVHTFKLGSQRLLYSCYCQND